MAQAAAITHSEREPTVKNGSISRQPGQAGVEVHTAHDLEDTQMTVAPP